MEINDEDYKRLKRIARNYNPSEFVAKMTDLFEELFEELDRTYEAKDSYDGWLDPKDRYKP
jgi:hypothetical protein